MSGKLLALDFDGVFVDSAYECYKVILSVCKKLSMPVEDSPELEKNFRVARTFVLSGKDYIPIMHAITKEQKDFRAVTQQEFNELKEKYSQGVDEFLRIFYEIRRDWQTHRFDEWCALHTFYPGMKEVFEHFSQKIPTVIATAKDQESAYLLLKKLGCAIEKNQITGREFSPHKTDQMKKLSEQYGVALHDIVFLEDMVQNAQSVRNLGVKSALVEWGYSNDKQKEEAKSLGIPIVKKENIIEQVTELMK